MTYTSVTVGLIQTNCYLVYDETTKAAVVIDPGDELGKIQRLLQRLELRVLGILLTHGHFDHVGAARALAEETGAPVYLHRGDLELPTRWRGRLYADHFYDEGDRLDFEGLSFQVLHTPGHTPGGVCLRCGALLFTGDTLFAGACGRTDLGGSWPQLAASLRRLAALEGNCTVLPGHGEASTLEEEREGNPYMQMAVEET